MSEPSAPSEHPDQLSRSGVVGLQHDLLDEGESDSTSFDSENLAHSGSGFDRDGCDKTEHQGAQRAIQGQTTQEFTAQAPNTQEQGLSVQRAIKKIAQSVKKDTPDGKKDTPKRATVVPPSEPHQEGTRWVDIALMGMAIALLMASVIFLIGNPTNGYHAVRYDTTMHVRQLSYTIHHVEFGVGQLQYETQAGTQEVRADDEFVVVNMTVRAGVFEGRVDLSRIRLLMSDGTVINHTPVSFPGELPEVSLPPEHSAAGFVVFDVPKDVTGLILHISANGGEATQAVPSSQLQLN